MENKQYNNDPLKITMQNRLKSSLAKNIIRIMNKKIIFFIFMLCTQNTHLSSMDKSKLPVVTIGRKNVDIFDKNKFQEYPVEYPITTWNWLSEWYCKDNINAMNANISSINQKPILFAEGRVSLFTLHYLSKHHTQFSALILHNPEHHGTHTISELHEIIPATLPVVFVNSQQKLTHCTQILYEKMKERKGNNTYLITVSSQSSIIKSIMEILSYAKLLQSDVSPNVVSFQPAGNPDIQQSLKGIKQAETFHYYRNMAYYACLSGFIISFLYIITHR